MTLHDILARRVRFDPDTGCRIWIGGFDNGIPCAWIDGKKWAVRRYLIEQTTGEPLPRGHRATTTCGRQDCVALEHSAAKTPGWILHALLRRGLLHGPIWRARVTATKQAQCGKLTPERAKELRARYRAGGVRQEDLAVEFNVSQQIVSRVVRNRSYKNGVTPLAALVQQQVSR